MAALNLNSRPVYFPAALIAAAGKTGNPANPINTRNGKNGKGRKQPISFSGTKDSDAHREIAERYGASSTRGRLYSSVTIETGSPGCKTSQRLTSLDLDLICAAGLSRHWGTSLIRLKYGLDPTVYRSVLRQWQHIATDTGDRLQWPDRELTAFLAEDVLLGWLLDRAFQGKGEWKRRCIFLRNKLNMESLEAASIMALKLGGR